ncbi:katanin p80 WD40 repeat-containing subunit B1 homolog KTN80.4-like [Salvia hispanica]|uniref:katanin p80 WD40 repeat-containing subunit B1 homolog KTN80.4-like n=1 Tax=Salvia hispanica TaxID=49212 RepID=UPI0020095B17|nr:katanin p80 WD40 repeat-containing subunit B1 homolog KTN80.4-like [Salvia hispanica]
MAESVRKKKKNEFRGNSMNVEASHVEGQRGGRTQLILPNWEQKGRSSYRPGLASSNISGRLNARSYPSTDENESVSATDEDTIADLVQQHDQFVGSMRSRLGKLQIVLNYWQRHDIRGALGAISKMGDQSVLADVSTAFHSMPTRHQDIALDMLIKLVRVFGSVIYSSLSAPASGWLERCNLCYVELEKLKCSLPALSTRGGNIAKSALELNLALQEV